MGKVPSKNPQSIPLHGHGQRGLQAAKLIIALLLLYLFVTYVIMPMDWRRYARKHPTLDDIPGITQTGAGIPGDPLNVALIGTETNVKTIMLAAKWYPADPLTLRSCLEIAEASVLKRPYDDAPVSSLYLFGRKEDLAFEQPVGDNPRHRHHVRFWRTDKIDPDGRPIWIGSAIYDKRVGLSRTTGQITHVTDADVDAERDYLFRCLEKSGDLSDTYTVDDFHKILKGKNGGGDPWETDGRLYVGVIAPNAVLVKQSPQQVSQENAVGQGRALAGSKSCRDCHEEFYKLWSTSWHGLAMQPYTEEFAKANLLTQNNDVTIGKNNYKADLSNGGSVKETGPNGERKYPIVQVMGGKNVYYFLTPMDRGRLQVLPIAYDVHKKAWYDMAASGVRHFPDRADEALNWTDRMFAFNTTCFNCHVSELSTNYDLTSDTYHTTWVESGISCESCHGPAGKHVIAMEAAAEGQPPKDIKLIRAKDLNALQMNDMCASCHAKIIPMSNKFMPGEKFFDHYDIVTLENPDYYPDGRDLGENYTYTSWLRSSCVKSGKLDCNHCHTPSGRMRFEGEKSNQMCMPCHEHYVKNPIDHGHHQPDSKGNECVGCHMPMTRFAAMGRTDHSMLPPTPATTIAFKSPNACNICHADKDTAWSDEWVGEWYTKDYQDKVLERAKLIDQARKHQWARLPDILAELKKKDGDQIYKNSLVRLLNRCEDESKWPVLLELLHDESPLVRSSAAMALGTNLTPESFGALLAATADESRLVRIRAAISLAAIPPDQLKNDRDRANLKKAVNEFMTAMTARPDDWASYANIGNFYMDRGDFSAAAGYFETASKLEPRQIGPMVNASIAYSNMKRTDKAEQCLLQALKYEPNNAAANFNLGLLRGEQDRIPDAESALRKALKADPQMSQAAYNLAIILTNSDMDEAIKWCQKAHLLRPNDSKYAYTLAFYLRKKGDTDAAAELLRQIIKRDPVYWDAYFLLGDIHENKHDIQKAKAVYSAALKMEQLPPDLRQQLEAKFSTKNANPSK